MKKYIIILSLVLFGLYSWSQNFPPPTQLVCAFPDEIIMFWRPPEAANPSYYNIYRRGSSSANSLLIASTPDTFYSYLPFFHFYHKFEVTAVYLNPNGESIPEGPCTMSCSPMQLPFNVTFEEPYAPLGNAAISGYNSWLKIDSTAYEGQHCALLPSSPSGDTTIMFFSVWAPDTSSVTYLNFWAKVPGTDGISDTLDIRFNENRILDSIHSINEWSFFEYTIIDTSYAYGIFFEGISGGGSGIYIDNINMESLPVAIQNTHIGKDNLFEIHPNPSNGQVIIRLSPDVKNNVIITIYDVWGRNVTTAFNGIIGPQTKSIILDLESFGKGLYFVQLRSQNSTFTQRLLIN